MGKETKAVALVVEDDQAQRAMVAMLLEETDIQVIQCESAEAAELVLEKVGGCLCMMFTDVNLAGMMTGAGLATEAKTALSRFESNCYLRESSSNLTRGNDLFMPKPWRPLDVVRETRAITPLGRCTGSADTLSEWISAAKRLASAPYLPSPVVGVIAAPGLGRHNSHQST